MAQSSISTESPDYHKLFCNLCAPMYEHIAPRALGFYKAAGLKEAASFMLDGILWGNRLPREAHPARCKQDHDLYLKMRRIMLEAMAEPKRKPQYTGKWASQHKHGTDHRHWQQKRMAWYANCAVSTGKAATFTDGRSRVTVAA